MFLSENEKGVLLLAAREAIQSLFGGMGPSEVNFNTYPNLHIKAGAFVTLKINNRLRGCIGYITSNMTLFDTVISAAKQAATNDPRFPELEEDEINKIHIEISVLSPPESIKSYEDIKIGFHGILLEEDNNKALLLPQVAVEHNFDVPRFLTALCEKAWLDPHAWRERQLNINVFTSIVFSESGKRKRTYVTD
jgi:AmmeMemoRadiSam system protein A